VEEFDLQIRSAFQHGRARRRNGPDLQGNAFHGMNGCKYFMGIIDILQRYTVKKRMETIIKSVPYDKDEISCVSPDKYAKRFREFMGKAIVDGEFPSSGKK